MATLRFSLDARAAATDPRSSTPDSACVAPSTRACTSTASRHSASANAPHGASYSRHVLHPTQRHDVAFMKSPAAHGFCTTSSVSSAPVVVSGGTSLAFSHGRYGRSRRTNPA